MDFVTKFIEYSKDYESPTSFWRWSAYALIGSISRHYVYYQYQDKFIYPNIYVCLLADSAAFRKGGPFDAVEELAKEAATTKVISGSASIQGIMDRLSVDIAHKKGGVAVKGGGCLLLAEELAAFFVDDPRLKPMLTNFYNYRKTFSDDLRGNKTAIDDLCVTLLAASNETFLREIYDQTAVYGGLLRRTLLVKPDEKRHGNSLMGLESNYQQIQLDKEEARKWLFEKIREVGKVRGAITISQDAKVIYNEWYLKIYKSYDTAGSKIGVLEGIHNQVLKIAIIIAVSQFSLEVTDEVMKEAISQVSSLKPNYEMFAMSSGASQYAQIQTSILAFIWKTDDKKITHRNLMARFWYEITASEFDQYVLPTFVQAGLITIMAIKGEPGYELSPKCIEKFETIAAKTKANASNNGTP